VLSPPGKFESVHKSLTQLQQRSTWSLPKQILQFGGVVLLTDNDIPHCQWPICKVYIVHPSSMVRKVTVQLGDPGLTSKGKRTKALKFLERPANKLVLLLENGS
jgi:ribosomal protein RSM22 (predicted rRNA methylase)